MRPGPRLFVAAIGAALFLAPAQRDAPQQHVDVRGMQQDHLVGLGHLGVETLEIVEVKVKLLVAHMPQAVQVFREDLGVFDQLAVLNARAVMALNDHMVLDSLEQKLHLQREAPAGHIPVIRFQKPIIEHRFVEDLKP